jgi:hypothetical protein
MGFIENWKNGESAVGRWLAETATGTVIKSVLAPVILWAGESAGSWDLPPWSLVAIVGAVPTLINLLNPSDTRMGIGAKKE